MQKTFSLEYPNKIYITGILFSYQICLKYDLPLTQYMVVIGFLNYILRYDCLDYCGGIQYVLSGILECLGKFLLFLSVTDKSDYIKRC